MYLPMMVSTLPSQLSSLIPGLPSQLSSLIPGPPSQLSSLIPGLHPNYPVSSLVSLLNSPASSLVSPQALVFLQVWQPWPSHYLLPFFHLSLPPRSITIIGKHAPSQLSSLIPGVTPSGLSLPSGLAAMAQSFYPSSISTSRTRSIHHW